MNMWKKIALSGAVALLMASASQAWAWGAKYHVYRVGSSTDVQSKPEPGYLLMGGGIDLDGAFTTLCNKAHGGDVVVLRGRGDDEYSRYINGLCKVNSVTTYVVGSRRAAMKPEVAEALRHAEAIFISGGDQSRYIRFWKGTPVQAEMNNALARGVPIGGTSAGLAVLGEFVYSSLYGSATTAKTLLNPFDKDVTLDRGFLEIPLLKGVITDTHFDTRDRMGRLLVFMARVFDAYKVEHLRAIAVDEKGALDIEPDGSAHVVGARVAYFIDATAAAQKCAKDTPLSFGPVKVYSLTKDGSFDVKQWTGVGGKSYELKVVDGVVQSTQEGGAIY